MSKPVSLILLVVGVVLIGWGLSAADSIGSQFSEFFTGTPTDETVWLIVGGVAAVVLGLFGLMRR